jgi:hypothetical protein
MFSISGIKGTPLRVTRGRHVRGVESLRMHSKGGPLALIASHPKPSIIKDLHISMASHSSARTPESQDSEDLPGTRDTPGGLVVLNQHEPAANASEQAQLEADKRDIYK